MPSSFFLRHNFDNELEAYSAFRFDTLSTFSFIDCSRSVRVPTLMLVVIRGAARVVFIGAFAADALFCIFPEGRGRTVDEWKPRPEQPDNHWLDCLVGSAVAASMQGALLFGTDLQATPKRDRISFREMQRKTRN